MIEKYLWIAGSIPLIVLGTIHLLYTFFTNKFSCRNQLLQAEMEKAFMVLTRQTTIWKAWMGFNASHSMGVIYIGIVNLVAAVWYFGIVARPAFMLLNIIVILFYGWLARKYWFSIPFKGLLVTAICFLVAALLILFSGNVAA